MSLEAVVYTSSAIADITEADLERLLEDARRKNDEVGVTGVLLYHDGAFLQYFEGPPAAVEEVYQRIRRSRLHRGLIELTREPVTHRSFDQWVMGFTRVPPSTLLQMTNASWESLAPQLGDESGSASDGLKLLLHFWSSKSSKVYR